MNATSEKLSRIKGLGPAKRAEILAVVASAKRSMAEQLRAKPVSSEPGAVANYLQLLLGQSASEVFVVLF